MTVAALILELQKHDPTLEVVLKGYEGGLQTANERPEVVEILRNINTEWYYGEHVLATDYRKQKYPNKQVHKALLIK